MTSRLGTGKALIFFYSDKSFVYCIANLVAVLPVPLVQEMHVVAHGHQRIPDQHSHGSIFGSENIKKKIIYKLINLSSPSSAVSISDGIGRYPYLFNNFTGNTVIFKT